MVKYIGFYVYHRSCQLWSPVIVTSWRTGPAFVALVLVCVVSRERNSRIPRIKRPQFTDAQWCAGKRPGTYSCRTVCCCTCAFKDGKGRNVDVGCRYFLRFRTAVSFLGTFGGILLGIWVVCPHDGAGVLSIPGVCTVCLSRYFWYWYVTKIYFSVLQFLVSSDSGFVVCYGRRKSGTKA